MPDQHFFRKFAIDLLQERLDRVLWRQRHGGAAVNIDTQCAPVLVAVTFPEKHQMAIGIGPAEIVSDVTVGDPGDRPRRRRIGHRRHPQIVYTVDRRNIGELQAVGAHPHIGAVGIVEENLARHQAGVLGVRRSREPGKRQRRTERGGTKQEIAAVDRRGSHAGLPSRGSTAAAPATTLNATGYFHNVRSIKIPSYGRTTRSRLLPSATRRPRCMHRRQRQRGREFGRGRFQFRTGRWTGVRAA
jgi:hypothetical protein